MVQNIIRPPTLIKKMRWFDRIRQIKHILIVVALLIVAASLLVSHKLRLDMEREEYQRMEIWADAMRALNRADEHTDLGLVLKVINGNNNIPVIVVDGNGRPLLSRNVKLSNKEKADSVESLMKYAAMWKASGNYVRMATDTKDGKRVKSYSDVCYGNSRMLQRLSLYPYVQLSVVLVFVAVVVFALMAFKRAEQDKVWVGLSKETAHQLGTPISSLMAWTEVLSETYPDSSLIPELGNDVKRLQLIAERFSKIGSAPELQPADIVAVIDNAVEYMSHRKSNHVEMIRYYEKDKIITVLNAALFEWVIENLAKNAMDAIQGHGKITFHVFEERGKVMVDVSDTGKGIPRSKYQSVFTPGYTTKQRGWGLGLSLARRIVEDYHHGKIYVLYSEINKGTTFRIEMPLPGGGKGRA